MNQTANLKIRNGFTSVEALVAFLILSVGMLGIASLQTISLRSSQTASLRTVAAIKAGEILERIRANPSEVNSYAVAADATGTYKGCNSGINKCAPADMAADDIFAWKKSLTEALPDNAEVTASIVVAPRAAGSALFDVTVTINWEEPAVKSKNIQTQSYSVTTSICGAVQC